MTNQIVQSSNDAQVPDAGGGYDATSILFHWLTATLVVSLWGMAQASVLLSRGRARHVLWSAHILLGMFLFLVAAGRIYWRLKNGKVFHSTKHSLFSILDKAVHWMLYLLLAGTLSLGVANTGARGWDFFGLVTIPKFDPSDTQRNLARALNGWHDLAANAIMILAFFHALAAMFHHYVLRDDVLNRMLGRGQRPTPTLP